MAAKTYDGQTGRFLATVATCMPTLSGEVMQSWINNPTGLKKALTDSLNPPTAGKKRSTKIHPIVEAEKSPALGPAATVPAGRLKKAFKWETRSGLYLYMDGPMGEFLALVPSMMQPTDVAPLARRDILRYADDAEIDAVPSEPEVTPEHIAALIEAQWGGTSGSLLNSGRSNRFRCRGLVVNVRWYSDSQYWRVRVWHPGGDGWLEGIRAFSSN